jgi:hypothetical protein
METRKVYLPKDAKYAKEDFDRIDSIKKTATGKFIAVKGLLHLYGYKIAGEGLYSGFYDVINQQFYTKDDIKNATIIENETECIYESPVKPKKLRK